MRYAAIAALCLVPVLSPLPAVAQGEAEEEGLTLMERGAQMFFEGLLDEMEPAIDGMQSLAEEIGPGMAEVLSEMGPALRDLMGRVDDLTNYEPPVVLPNGDILLRRKPEAPDLPEVGPNGDVEL
ncbi:MAG: hypothetical protein AAFO58_03060 [Pseudomonadota bacterium]